MSNMGLSANTLGRLGLSVVIPDPADNEDDDAPVQLITLNLSAMTFSKKFILFLLVFSILTVAGTFFNVKFNGAEIEIGLVYLTGHLFIVVVASFGMAYLMDRKN